MTDGLLPSWRDGATRTAILSFLDQANDIPPDDRVAVFDNDGTMWCEKPGYTQLEFFKAELPWALENNPSLGGEPVIKAILAHDREQLEEIGLEGVATALLNMHAGLTPQQFDERVAKFFAESTHADRGVPYKEQRYQPMLELMDELRARGFDFYIVTGGGAEFVRVISNEFYAVRPEGVVGSQIAYDLADNDDGTVSLIRTNHPIATGPNEGRTKPPNIQRILGRRPVVAGGNSAGDAEMLQYAMGYDGPSLALLVNHDDGDREYAYESKAGTFDAEESILDTAARLGWTVASIKDDWSTVFVTP
jgi:hypothetical protein